MSSSQLISEPSDQSSPSLPVTGLPLSTPQQPSSSSSSPQPPPPLSPPLPLQTPVIPLTPIKSPQLTETLIDTLVSDCQQPLLVIKETDIQLTPRITPDLKDTLMLIEDKKEANIENELQTEVTTVKLSMDFENETDIEVESKGESEAEKPLAFSLQQQQPEFKPVEEQIEKLVGKAIPEPVPESEIKIEIPISKLVSNDEPMEICEFEPHVSSTQTTTITTTTRHTQSPIPLMAPPPPQQAAQSQPSYHLKWIKLKGNKCPIVTQNENGPCPLIAIINVLLVKGRLRLPSMMEVITANQLIEYLGDCILENIPKGLKEEEQLNYEQNMHDAIAILPKLQTGLDVNVRFTGVSDFEYTPELIFFDLLHIPLYHGWLVDPNDIETVTSIGNLSYNQLVDKIITHKTSTRPELAFEALVVEQFLERTASQLTYHGLSQLNSTLKDGELSVLFRNNHFITLLKSKDQLYQLVTDQGFLTESRVVWETLTNIENDGLFVDGDFIPVPPKPSLTAEDQQVQVDQDYLIALSLQEEQKKEFEKEKEWETYKTENGLNELSDEEFARKLQEEEKRKAGQLTNYQGDDQNGQSSQNESNQLNQSHNNEQSRDNLRSPGSGNKRSHSLPSRKTNSNKPDDKSNARCSMM